MEAAGAIVQGEELSDPFPSFEQGAGGGRAEGTTPTGAGGGASQEAARRSRKWSVSNLHSLQGRRPQTSRSRRPSFSASLFEQPGDATAQGGASRERDKQLDILVNMCGDGGACSTRARRCLISGRRSRLAAEGGKRARRRLLLFERRHRRMRRRQRQRHRRRAAEAGAGRERLLVVDGVLSMKPGSSTKPSSGAAGSSSSNNNGGAGSSSSGGGSGGMEEKADMPTRSWCDASESDLSKMLRTSMAEDVETFIQFTGANKQTAIAHVQEGGVNNGVSIDEIIGRYFEGKESVRNSDAYRQMEVDELMARASSGLESIASEWIRTGGGSRVAAGSRARIKWPRRLGDGVCPCKCDCSMGFDREWPSEATTLPRQQPLRL